MSTDDGIGSGSEDELFLAEKEWKKLNVKSTTEGFREGISQASEDSLQSGFDKGYSEAFQTGLLFGKLRGKLSAKRLILGEGSEHIAEIDIIEAELNKCEETCKSNDDEKTQIKMKANLEELEKKFKLIASM
jgi:hypothetical protein